MRGREREKEREEGKGDKRRKEKKCSRGYRFMELRWIINWVVPLARKSDTS